MSILKQLIESVKILNETGLKGRSEKFSTVKLQLEVPLEYH